MPCLLLVRLVYGLVTWFNTKMNKLCFPSFRTPAEHVRVYEKGGKEIIFFQLKCHCVIPWDILICYGYGIRVVILPLFQFLIVKNDSIENLSIEITGLTRIFK